MQKVEHGETQVAPEPELVKGLGLIGATALVMGSMIGSAIFIVSAEIAREVNSPAPLIAAWRTDGSPAGKGQVQFAVVAQA